MNGRIAKLEVKRARLHDYILVKLEDRDYHGVADAAMDLRELETEVKLLLEIGKFNPDKEDGVKSWESKD